MDEELVLEYEKSWPGGKRYCRSASKARQHLERGLKEVYGMQASGACLVLSSGMNAVGAVMSVFNTGPFIIGSELYCDIPKAAKDICSHVVVSVDIRSEKEILSALRKHPRAALLFVEAVTNPSGQLMNFKRVLSRVRRQAPNCVVCVDNTWCTGLGFNPFLHGADLVVESTTKYISGGTRIGGFVMGPTGSRMNRMRAWARTFGQHVPADHCQGISNGLVTLSERMMRVSELSIEMASWLEEQGDRGITRVLHPMLPSHGCHDLAKELLVMSPGCIWLHVETDCPNNELKRRYKRIGNETRMAFETSYGSPHSKIDPWPKIGHSAAYDLGGVEAGKPGLWLRMAVGWAGGLEETQEAMLEVINLIHRGRVG